MTRVVSLYFPAWPTDRLRRAMGKSAPSVETPIVMLGRQGNRRLVLAADAAARAAGMRVGMPASKAQVLVPGLLSFDLDPAGDAAALERMALWSLRYAPIVAADRPDGLIIDTTGADHLHGGEDAMLEGLVSRMAASGIAAHAAVADSWGAAHAFARFLARPTFIAPARQDAAIMCDLPIGALRLPSEIVEGLHTLGFERVGEVEAAPRASLTLRFGPELGRRLDQAMGRRAEPFEPARSPEVIEVRRAFGEPISAAETIARYTGKLVTALCEALEAGGLGARRLDLLLHRVDNRIEAIRVGTAVPVRDIKRLTRLLTDRIETVDPGFGIEVMTLTATLAEPFASRQIISSLVDEPEPDITDLIDTLANRIGEQRLYRFSPVESDVPERSVRRVAATAPDDGTSWPGEWPRPPRLLPHPEPIETMALLPDHPPVWFSWRGIRRRVARADGPERVFGEWWQRDAELIAVRDYFQVEDESGDRFWIYRAGDGEDPGTGSHKWFLHGVFA
ncbi:DNA polymerase Y family protein [Mesorhizobium sp.]|uniref:Y-family DNA polymerase n=1 Tax=Mesorhizobium sp. TaxID=1871066 RepID=UPI000FEA214E|nr:DNA polymerase Y family protein [Mesorhizobium sp.]RWK43788.1 MAG: DNA polymerase Y family protein [Mesorhizobium sp.]